MAKFEFYEWILIWILAQEGFLFEWDEGNSTKSLEKHQITCNEAESVFERPEWIKVLGVQISPEVSEERFGLFGKTKDNKNVFIAFTIRNSKIRVISVRKLNQKEEKIYEALCEK